MKFISTAGFVLLLLCVFLVGCGDQTPHVTNAILGTIVNAGKITDPKTTFIPGEHMIHLVVQVENALTNTSVGAKWYQVGDSNRLLYQDETALDAFNTS